MENKLNLFIEPIIEKKSRHDFKSYIKMRKLCKKLSKTSPDFNTLMGIYEFLILLSYLYMHSSNDENLHLFAATVPKGTDGGAFIYEEDNFHIKFLMRNYDKSINIELELRNRNKKDTRTISFRDGEAVINDKYDEEMFRFIIACIMDEVINLIKHYYKNKRF